MYAYASRFRFPDEISSLTHEPDRTKEMEEAWRQEKKGIIICFPVTSSSTSATSHMCVSMPMPSLCFPVNKK
jgi:hypothetical protein